VLVRGLGLATALAPPFLLARAGLDGGRELGELGLFVVAAAVATMASSAIWGRAADASSRRVMIGAALLGAVALGLAAVVPSALLPALLFVLLVAHQGLRLARKTQLVDMAPRSERATYTAIANTATGVLLLAGGGFGLVAEAFGPAVVLVLLAGIAAAAAALATGLREVQG